jgi:hypothetical protein
MKDVLVNSGHSGPFRTPEWIPPEVHIIFYHSVLLHPHKISVQIVQICYLNEIEWEQNKKSPRYVTILAMVGPLGPPCWAPRVLHSRLSFSTTLSALDQCNYNKNILPE